MEKPQSSTFEQTRLELKQEQQMLQEQSAAWLLKRNALAVNERMQLDEQFNAIFEQLGTYFLTIQGSGLPATLGQLQDLIEQGASASTLGHHELGAYNLAMFIKNLSQMEDPEILALAEKVIKQAIVSGADLYQQKAYVGNGGSTCLEWVLLYLGQGIDANSLGLKALPPYMVCYRILPWLMGDDPDAGKGIRDFFYFEYFLQFLRNSPQVAPLQEKVMQRLMCHGYALFEYKTLNTPAFYFNKLAGMNLQWLTMLFPSDEPAISIYLEKLRRELDAGIIKDLLNAFTSNNKARKYFKSFFSSRPHWLLHAMIDIAPQEIFRLVQRNEQDILIPFLKHYKRDIAQLRNHHGQTILQHATTTRGVVENTLALLRNAHV
ncbi:MAG: hypothetical protein JO154_07235 [Chitinophaga sp.]|uniref:hypothetical protein n=1 Tax=Chitinophaga sp. TaxID=1869181 RepID=UPI0025B9EDC8|nr:hypothetical protein [Chitinophaga sp.]MBV8252386.1 hypothetical protein [Chitinophaga sp.]